MNGKEHDRIFVSNNPVNWVDWWGLHFGGPDGPGDHGDIGGSESNSDSDYGGYEGRENSPKSRDDNISKPEYDPYVDSDDDINYSARSRINNFLNYANTQQNIKDELIKNRDKYLENMSLNDYLEKVHSTEDAFDSVTEDMVDFLDDQREKRRQGDCKN